ncbi:MAG: histidine kinase [Bacteroidales bacterium]|nr:histidine kinase [Bacteroidales bacterium]
MTDYIFNFFLFTTCILQVIAAVVSLKLIRVTRFNVSWILISAGLVAMSIRSVIKIISIFIPDFGFETEGPFSWGGLFVSFCFTIGIFMIRKIFRVLQNAEEQQRAYEKQRLMTIIDTEENERKRFATELHDGLGPILSTIKMGFSAITSDIRDTEIRDNLSQAISEAIITVREVSNNLSPLVLNNFGIDKAVRNFLGKLTLPPTLKIDYDISIGDKRYSPTKEIVIYRVFCELLNNTLKHAQATIIHFSISEEDNTIQLKYYDNGIGFDPADIQENPSSGNGYYNMLSRVSSLKGTAIFKKGEEHGMFAYIKIPTND